MVYIVSVDNPLFKTYSMTILGKDGMEKKVLVQRVVLEIIRQWAKLCNHITEKDRVSEGSNIIDHGNSWTEKDTEYLRVFGVEAEKQR